MKNLKHIEHWKIIAFFAVIYDFAVAHISYFLALWLRFDCNYSAITPRYLNAYLSFITWYAVLAVVIFHFFHMHRMENTTGDDKEKYFQWVDKYVTPKYFPQPYIDENDNFQQSEKRAFTGTRCYGLRCAVLHSGNEDLSRNHMDLDDESGIAPSLFCRMVCRVL